MLAVRERMRRQSSATAIARRQVAAGCIQRMRIDERGGGGEVLCEGGAESGCGEECVG